ncbi:ribosomal large subunit pseudouridine synthase D [Rhodonellum psychrophilum GCM71 = DSM 17998]|uniref:Pseudouridine synthase n=2 Tax=Rhodonellum TaxID=336827 RepID=U5BX82_9BACT|nr:MULTISPECIES: RluA family pseudouridine synthase [Rhodonellum]ERM82463.1 ribosomal large subunit pseudouridine synthase D [Rhodonellum psychrophilum GCM71 = DSM 17998]SDY69177.1 23S rRNA pseudouridine1911/1915/1917 synthase [Rhodonellum ikkaensis]
MEEVFDGEEFEEEELELFEHYNFIIDKGQSPTRIDKFLTERVTNATRNKVQNAIDTGMVLVNGAVTKSNYKVRPLDEVKVMMESPSKKTESQPEDLDLDILYEDEHLMIVNKPAGMVVHPAHGNWTGTLVNGLMYHFNQLPELPGNTGRPGLVHRIDKDTSGLLVVAKSELAMSDLAGQFFHHTIERTYLALVWGEPKDEVGTINTHVGRSAKNRKVIEAYPDGSQGKHAITHWKVLKSLRYVSLVQCNLETGRTHQIRAHMRYIGHPLFNDAMYGGDKIRKGTQFSKYKSFVHNCFAMIPRQALHAMSLGFVHPFTKEKMYFEAPLPADFAQVLEKWENYVTYEN